MTDPDVFAKKFDIGRAFSPGAPIDEMDLFSGRSTQVDRLIAGINQRGQHVMLFGERGVGKTSLANVMEQILRDAGGSKIIVAKVNCSAGQDFTSIWEGVFRELNLRTERRLPGFESDIKEIEINLTGVLPSNPQPDHVRHALSRIGAHVVVILDELDRIGDTRTTAQIADLIKSISDHSVRATILLVGVADAVDELISSHASIERSLVQIRMPRMSYPELEEIIVKGLNKVDMTISDNAKKYIVELSMGLPHYTHLLSQHSANSAVVRNAEHIEKRDVSAAIAVAIANVQESIASAYHKAVLSPSKKALFAQVLCACAQAPTDELGYFSAADIRDPLSTKMGRYYDIPSFASHLKSFCEPDRGPILQRIGTARRYRYRFTNPMMQPFVRMMTVVENE